MAVRIEEGEVQGFPSLDLCNEALSLRVIPRLGGKIASIRSRQTGREWMWTSPHLAYAPMRYGASYVRHFDTGGFDECFPTVDACYHPSFPWQGIPVPDHGEVFAQEWAVARCGTEDDGSAAVRLMAHGVRFPYRFERTLTLHPEKAVVRLDYALTSLCPFSMPFIWSAHPIMAIEPGMRIAFPAGTGLKLSQSPDDYLGRAGAALPWPHIPRPDGPHFDLSEVPDPHRAGFRPFAVKLFTTALAEGWAELRSGDGAEAFRFAFRLDPIRHVALWLNYGAWSGSGSPNYFNMAFEPVIGDSDGLDTAVRLDHGAATLEPFGRRAWTLEIEVR